MRMISDVVRIKRTETTDDQVFALDGKRTSPRVNYRPDKQPPVETIVNAYDNGRLPPIANDNKRLPYPLKDMAAREELGDNEFENRRNWANAELFRIHLAIALGEPLYDPFADDQTVKYPTERFLHARQVVARAEDFLGDGFRVLKRVMVDCWTAQMVGSESGRHNNRATASASGQAMILSALRQLTKFYDKLDRIEQTGESPRFVMPMVGTFPAPRPAFPRPQHGKSYLNQTPGPVTLAEPWVSTAAQRSVVH
jgi:hypothetical protein